MYLLVITWLGDLKEAYTLIKDVEPAGPQEYVIKAVVNAALGQAEGSVSFIKLYKHPKGISFFLTSQTLLLKLVILSIFFYLLMQS